ncbi:cofactor assembly of complex C subunit B [Thermocoleostomius sinensis]|uniref:Cofactor assembly of complex C subunit B n=1 Tax=Thermocoleostomius sinensis A174 TaxID=2016057 RepID=A0A9E8ZEU0_9CYAN|nr:cofactor assembly of complex C subunit B [Thermocoleostomius sinensis]WAL62064.1 cofactor assembly of complex C subunit B [Thermocoleostomius sinensis A174]
MQNSVLLSTALLTLLLSIGLFFFIRASTKDRTQISRFVTEQRAEPLFEQLQQYFTRRAYRLTDVDAARNQITFEGLVRPSAFLAVFLTLLAAIGIFCLSLVLSLLFPKAASLFPLLVLFAPIAGIFYWQKAGRSEQVLLRVETLETTETNPQSLLTVTAHRDELAEMRRLLGFKELEEDAIG